MAQSELITKISGYRVLSSAPYRDGVTLGEYSDYYNNCLANIYSRTTFGLDRQEYRFCSDAESKRAETLFDESSNLIKISLVSSNIVSEDLCAVPEGEELSFLEKAEDRKLAVPGKSYNRKAWIEKRMNELSQALAYDSDIICFPEFAFPPPEVATDGSMYRELSTYSENIMEYDRMLTKSLSGKFGPNREDKESLPFIFSGSFHCPLEYFHPGKVYPCAGFNGTELEVGIIKQALDEEGDYEEPVRYESVIHQPINHLKRYSARKVGETARAPSDRGFFTYSKKKFHLGILICSDIVDLNQYINYIRLNAYRLDRRKLDIILVPAFNKSDVLPSMCRELSFLTGALVCYVGANSELPIRKPQDTTRRLRMKSAKKFPRVQAFFHGFDLDQLSDSIYGSVISNGPKCSSVGNSSVLSFTIRRDVFSHVKEELHKVEMSGRRDRGFLSRTRAKEE